MQGRAFPIPDITTSGRKIGQPILSRMASDINRIPPHTPISTSADIADPGAGRYRRHGAARKHTPESGAEPAFRDPYARPQLRQARIDIAFQAGPSGDRYRYPGGHPPISVVQPAAIDIVRRGERKRYRRHPGAVDGPPISDARHPCPISMPWSVRALSDIRGIPRACVPADIADAGESDARRRAIPVLHAGAGRDRTGRGGISVHRIPEPRRRRDRDHRRDKYQPKPDEPPSMQTSHTSSTAAIPHPAPTASIMRYSMEYSP